MNSACEYMRCMYRKYAAQGRGSCCGTRKNYSSLTHNEQCGLYFMRMRVDVLSLPSSCTVHTHTIIAYCTVMQFMKLLLHYSTSHSITLQHYTTTRAWGKCAVHTAYSIQQTESSNLFCVLFYGKSNMKEI